MGGKISEASYHDSGLSMLDSQELSYLTLKKDSSNSGLPSYFFMKNPGMLSMFSKIAGFRYPQFLHIYSLI